MTETKQTQKAGSNIKAEKLTEVAEKLNDIVNRTIEAFGLKPFLLRHTDVFQVYEENVLVGKNYVYLGCPYGLNLTAIGDWTDGVTIYFNQVRQTEIPTAKLTWSSGEGAARAELIYRASKATDALNFAFDEIRRKGDF